MFESLQPARDLSRRIPDETSVEFPTQAIADLIPTAKYLSYSISPARRDPGESSSWEGVRAGVT